MIYRIGQKKTIVQGLVHMSLLPPSFVKYLATLITNTIAHDHFAIKIELFKVSFKLKGVSFNSKFGLEFFTKYRIWSQIVPGELLERKLGWKLLIHCPSWWWERHFNGYWDWSFWIVYCSLCFDLNSIFYFYLKLKFSQQKSAVPSVLFVCLWYKEEIIYQSVSRVIPVMFVMKCSIPTTCSQDTC